jgi:hypothetical protein
VYPTGNLLLFGTPASAAESATQAFSIANPLKIAQNIDNPSAPQPNQIE